MKKNIVLIIFVVVAVALVLFLFNANQTKALRENFTLVSEDKLIMEEPNQDAAVSKALEYYYEKTGEAISDEITAEKINFGCHIEIHVYKNGAIEMRLSYSFGRIFEL